MRVIWSICNDISDTPAVSVNDDTRIHRVILKSIRLILNFVYRVIVKISDAEVNTKLYGC